jgi:CRISPR type III-B/RAMP module-associated protein Cmr5
MSVTRHQHWSAEALKRVSAKKDQSDEGKYRTLCMKMPGLIKQAGLVQALVFMKSREKDLASVHGAKDLLHDAQTAELAPYLALTSDLSQISIWFRRFAQIELKGDAEEPRS